MAPGGFGHEEQVQEVPPDISTAQMRTNLYPWVSKELIDRVPLRGVDAKQVCDEIFG
jgi:hypothetical protein